MPKPRRGEGFARVTREIRHRTLGDFTDRRFRREDDRSGGETGIGEIRAVRLRDKHGGGVTLARSEDGSGDEHFTLRSRGVRLVVPNERYRSDVDDEALFKVDVEDCGGKRRGETGTGDCEFERASVFD